MKNLLIFGIILVFAHLSFAQGISSQNAEKRLNNSVGGYSFSVPKGFTANQNDEGFSLVDEAKTIIIIVKSHNFNTFAAFSAQANLAADGFILVGKVQNLNETDRTFRASKTTAQGYLIADTFASFSPFGGGTLIVALSDANTADRAFQTATQISKSLTFTKPQVSDTAAKLQNAFKGKHLLYLYTGNGYSERKDIYLCRSGSFYLRNDASSLSQNGSGVTASNADGNWKITSNGSAKLVLNFRNGNVREYSISQRQASNEIGLNGDRYFVQDQNQCQ